MEQSRRLRNLLPTIVARKKARCTGTNPCVLCVRMGLECLYNASYRRGRTPLIPSASPDAWLADHRNPGSGSTTSTHAEATPFAPAIDNEFAGLSSEAAASDSEQTNVQNSYFGPASGVSFLTRAKRRLQADASAMTTTDSSVFTFGDTPLPECDSSFLVLPPLSEALVLIRTYFDISCPTHRYLHRPTVEIWCNDLYKNQMQSKFRVREREKNAVVLMVMAQATLTSNHGNDDKMGRR